MSGEPRKQVQISDCRDLEVDWLVALACRQPCSRTLHRCCHAGQAVAHGGLKRLSHHLKRRCASGVGDAGFCVIVLPLQAVWLFSCASEGSDRSTHCGSALNWSQVAYVSLVEISTHLRTLRVCSLANYCHISLECVKLSFCRNITMAVVRKLCRNCTRLKILHLYGCTITSDLFKI
ncbi:uncharacterized protein WM277_025463 [Molossus nigricans]